jgi:UPF0271 protein
VSHVLTPRARLILDAGERPAEIEGLWSLFDVLMCACGGHAGNAESMDRVAAFCARSTVQLGAHPSYPDPEGFGRRSPLATVDASAVSARVTEVVPLVEDAVASQCQALIDIARRRRVSVVAVKPHGALYHDADAHPAIAQALLRGATRVLGRGVTVVGPPSGHLRDQGIRERLVYAREGFADRRQRADGSLVPRSEPDALIVEPAAAAAQAAQLASNVEMICIHSDTPGALEIARAVREVVRA